MFAPSLFLNGEYIFSFEPCCPVFCIQRASSIRQQSRQGGPIKPDLTTNLVKKMSLAKVPESGISHVDWEKTDKPNCLAYDSNRKAPARFAVRVRARESIYFVEKMVSGEKLKIDAALAQGKKGRENPIFGG